MTNGEKIAALERRIQTIADECFGPFAEQSAEDNLTEIEKGISVFHCEIERRGAALREILSLTTDKAFVEAMPLGAMMELVGKMREVARAAHMKEE